MRGLLLGVFAGVVLGAVACGSGGEEDGCPGLVCSNCSGSGDCTISCPLGQVQYCGHFGYFNDPDLRCAYCGAQ